MSGELIAGEGVGVVVEGEGVSTGESYTVVRYLEDSNVYQVNGQVVSDMNL